MSAFERVWADAARFRAFAGADESEVAWCAVAWPFLQWCANLTVQAGSDPTLGKVKYAKAVLTDRYFAFRGGVGKTHRDVTRHPCLYQVFVEAWARLNELELALAPVELLPVAVSAPTNTGGPPQVVAGILLGEEA